MNLKAMQAGKARKQREAEQLAVRRVRSYVRWLKAGSVLRDIPEIPTDDEWKIARRKGIVP